MTWLRREDLEDQELHVLGRFAAKSRASGGRRFAEPEDPLRTAFQRDRDRILHSNAFRRLQGKTQVLAAFAGDHHRTRLTHSLEVSQMARSVALALRLNADLAEAIAVAHDLGHPPFGHVGEDALDARMREHGGFRHNAQGLRVVDVLEDRSGHGYGLNLTWAVRRSLRKGRFPAGFPVSADLDPGRPAPLEAQVVDLCDRIAYLCHDIDDGLREGVFTLDDVGTLGLWRRAAEAARAGADQPYRIVSEMVALLIHDLVQNSDRTLEQQRLAHGADVTALAQEGLAFLRERFYRAPRVLEVMHAGAKALVATFDRLLARPEQLPAVVRQRAGQDGLPRAVCDYVAGMTDRYLMARSGAEPAP
jgi:dGTPase